MSLTIPERLGKRVTSSDFTAQKLVTTFYWSIFEIVFQAIFPLASEWIGRVLFYIVHD